MLGIKVFGPMTSFGLRFLFYRTGFATDDLRRTTTACYRLGYCYALVDRVYEPKCDKRHKTNFPVLRIRELQFWRPVIFVEYFLSEETEGVLTDTVIYFYDQHPTSRLLYITGCDSRAAVTSQ